MFLVNLCSPVMPPKSERVRQSLEAVANGKEVLKKTRTDFETKNSETVPTTTGSVSIRCMLTFHQEVWACD